MAQNIAVQGASVEPQGIVTICAPAGVLTITSVPSLKVKAEGSGVYRGGVTFTIVGACATGYDPGTVVSISPITIQPGASKVKADGQFVNLENDNQLLVPGPTPNMTGTISGTPTPFFEPFAITDAGQTKVLAE